MSAANGAILSPKASHPTVTGLSENVAFRGGLSADILPHHPGILVFKDVAMVHEGMLSRGRSVKGDQKVGGILNENHVLPSRKMRWRWRTRERQDSKCRAVHMKECAAPIALILPSRRRYRLCLGRVVPDMRAFRVRSSAFSSALSDSFRTRSLYTVNDWLPKPLILHPWPSDRFARVEWMSPSEP